MIRRLMQCLLLLSVFGAWQTIAVADERTALEKTVVRPFTIELVDVSGKPVAGAKAGICPSYTADEKPSDWFYNSETTSGKDGIIRFSEGGDRLKERCLVARHAERKLVAIAEVGPDRLKKTLTLTMRPECRVSGKLTCTELDRKKQQLGWMSVALLAGGKDALHWEPDDKRAFQFFVPPGTYTLRSFAVYAHDPFDKDKTLTVKPGQRELDVGVIDLSATGVKAVKLPDAALAVLEQADRLELLSLNPDPPEEETPKDNFHGFGVLGRTVLREEKDRQKVVAAVKKGIGDSGFYVGCFNPRHGIRATRNGKTVDLVICFQCLNTRVYEGKVQSGVPTVRVAEPVLDKFLRDAGVKLAPMAEDEIDAPDEGEANLTLKRHTVKKQKKRGAAWGEAVDGVHCRLKAEKPNWKNGEVPSFKAEIRNAGERRLSVFLIPDSYELEFDGKTYRWSDECGKRISHPLPPGRHYKDLPVSLAKAWHDKNGKPSDLKPGKHKVRIVFLPEIVNNQGKRSRVISDEVEIEIASPDKTDDLSERPKQIGGIDDREKLQGAWKVVSLEDGNKGAPRRFANAIFAFSRDTLTIPAGDVIEEYPYRIDPGSKPREIDLVARGAMKLRARYVGIYQLNKDDLRICLNATLNDERPREFTSVGVYYILTLKRQPPKRDVPERVKTLMTSVRNQGEVDSQPVLEAPARAVIAELEKYFRDQDDRVSITAVSLALAVSKRTSDVTIQRRAAELMLAAFASEPGGTVARYTREHMLALPRHAFSDKAKREIERLVNVDRPDCATLMLAGLANVVSVKNRLLDISKHQDVERVWWGRPIWGAHLALARMGVSGEVQFCVKKVESEPDNVWQVTRIVLLRDLAYTRQPEAVKVLKDYLFSELRLPRDKPNVPGARYAEYALDLLAQIVEDFPIESQGPGGYGDENIAKARKWMKEHEKLRIRQ